jgi:DNA-directed RNA polymerase specialized sigma subunit
MTMTVMEIEKCIRDYRKITKEMELRMDCYVPSDKTAVQSANVFETEAARRSMSRIDRLWHRFRFVNERIDLLTDERERTVIDCMIDGMTLDEIGRHIGVTRSHVHRIKESALKQLHDSQFDKKAG